MAPRANVSEERRSQIVEAAGAVFARLGFHQARMEDVAEEARLSKGLLYWYFQSKDEIIAAILQRMFAESMTGLESLLEAEGTAEERLFSLAQQIVAEFKHMSRLRPIFYEFYAIAGRNPKVRESLRGYFQRFRQVVSVLVQQGIDRGEFRPVDPEEVAIAIAALYEGVAVLWMMDPATVTWDRVGTTPLRLLVQGLRAKQ